MNIPELTFIETHFFSNSRKLSHMKLVIVNVFSKSKSSFVVDFKCKFNVNRLDLLSGNNKNCLGVIV